MNIWPKTDDWCHVCGERWPLLADIFYATNAEHDQSGNEKYVRICACCAVLIVEACKAAVPRDR